MHRLTYIILGCAALSAVAAITRQPMVFITAYFIWGVLLGATTPVLMAQISKATDSARQGYVMGVAQSALQLASIAGISVGGLLSQVYGLQYTYLFVCAAYLLALIPIAALRTRGTPAPSGETAAGD